MDQLTARLDQARSEDFQRALEGPPPDLEYYPAERVWQEHELWCAVLRHRSMGHLMGYCQVPRGHPWWGMNEDHEVPDAQPLDEDLTVEQAIDDFGAVPTFLAAMGENGFENFERRLASRVQVHGGLTFAGTLPVQGAPFGWWLGFDAAHAGDATAWEHLPDYYRTDPMMRVFWQRGIDRGDHVWTVEEMAGEVGRLALAIHESRPSESKETDAKSIRTRDQ